jgi:hypothetical protein
LREASRGSFAVGVSYTQVGDTRCIWASSAETDGDLPCRFELNISSAYAKPLDGIKCVLVVGQLGYEEDTQAQNHAVSLLS